MATYYWGPSGGTSTGTWSAVGTTNWFTDVGRVIPAVSAPTSADDVVFDAASDNGTTFNVTLGAGAVCRNITVSNLDFTMTLTHSNLWVVYGSLSFPSTRLTRAGFQSITFAATSSVNIDFNGYDLDNLITFDGVGGTWQLLSDLGANNPAKTNLSVTLTNGSINLNGKVLYSSSLASNNSNVRSIAFNGGKISLYRNAVNVWAVQTATNFSYTGIPIVEATYSGSVGNRNLFHGTTTGATEANTPDFFVTAGTDTATIGNARNINLTGFSGTFANNGRNIYGSLTISSGTTVGSGASVSTFAATSGTHSITCSGKTLDFPITFDGNGGTWQFADAFAAGSTRVVTLTNGTLNGNSQNASLGLFALGAGTKTLTLGSGTWSVTGSGTAWDANTNVANLTVSASTGIISMNSASAKTFAGGAKSWPTLNQGGSGALTIQQSNTFANITDTVQPATVTLTAGTTQTVSSFTLAGTSGNLITLNSSSAGSQATLSDSSGINSVSFVSIKDINATGGAVWNAYTSSGNVDAGNNNGWDFNDLAFRYIYTRRKNKVIFPI